ncbi:peptidase [Croceibacterium mercuriale]|uniref:Peptidase n=2 Tax=Croceibacterium mercuriale TaxID=1572751 RepID=A0A0B2C310_9SPHN|nr:peptidase [Croceibacterium mercuriale]
MTNRSGWLGRWTLAMAGKRSPWGGGAPEDGPATPPSGEEPPARGPRNPWLPDGSGDGEKPPRRSAGIEDIFRNRGPEGPRRRTGGPGGPGGPNFQMPRRANGGSWVPIIGGTLIAVLLLATAVHQVGPKEQGIVSTFGKYSHTLNPGLNMTLPWPLQNVEVTDVTSIQSETMPTGNAEQLILTGDQNLVDLSYLIRWNIKDLRLFRYQLAEPQETLREVAEAAMRASVAEQTFDSVVSGAGRATVEERVRTRMQAVLDAYRSGIAIQGVDIGRTEPPEQVVEAFKDVSAAQQDADADINRAEAYSQQLLARAQGDAAEFNNIYEEYRQAPEVTRRRLYYETMESVLAKTNKTIVETDGVTPYLALPELQRRSSPQPAQTPSTQVPDAAPTRARAGAR